VLLDPYSLGGNWLREDSSKHVLWIFLNNSSGCLYIFPWWFIVALSHHVLMFTCFHLYNKNWVKTVDLVGEAYHEVVENPNLFYENSRYRFLKVVSLQGLEFHNLHSSWVERFKCNLVSLQMARKSWSSWMCQACVKYE
jgi:hypothetical protein